MGQDGGLFQLAANRFGRVMQQGRYRGFDDARMRETVYAVTLEDPSNLRVQVRGDFDTTVSVRRSCDDAAGEMGCERFDPLELRALEPGTWFVVVSPGGVVDHVVDIQVESLVRDCSDELDNDEDGLVDAADPGCRHGFDADETDPRELGE